MDVKVSSRNLGAQVQAHFQCNHIFLKRIKALNILKSIKAYNIYYD